MTQTARPASIIAAGGWTASSGTLDSATSDQSDSTYAIADSTDTSMQLKLGSLTDPSLSTEHAVYFRARISGGGGPGEKLDAYLYQGGTQIATLANNMAVNRLAFTEYSYNMTAGEADSITDYTDLRVHINKDTLASGEYLWVSEIWMVCPDAVVITNGTLNITLDGLGKEITGSVLVQAVLSKTLDDVTKTITGIVEVKGVVSKALDDVTQTITGAVTIQGVLSSTVDNAAIVATGTVGVAGTDGVLTITLDDVGKELSGTVLIQGMATNTLDDVVRQLTGTVLVSGDLTSTLDDVVRQLTGKILVQGEVVQTLDGLVVLATGAIAVAGVLDQAFDAITISATGTVGVAAGINGSLSAMLGNVAITATGGVLIAGALVKSLDNVTAVVEGTVANQITSGLLAVTLDGVTLSAYAVLLLIAGFVDGNDVAYYMVSTSDASIDTTSAVIGGDGVIYAVVGSDAV